MSFVCSLLFIDWVAVIEVFSFASYWAPLHGVRSGLPWLACACNRYLLSTFALQTSGLAGRSVSSNRLAERMIQTMKCLIGKAPDPYLALLVYLSTPLSWCGLSPAQLLMGRPLRTDVPHLPVTLTPEWSYLSEFHKKDKVEKLKQKSNYDWRHCVRDLPELSEDESVWVCTQNRTEPGRVITSAGPRSYVVETESGETEPISPHDHKATAAV